MCRIYVWAITFYDKNFNIPVYNVGKGSCLLVSLMFEFL